MRAGGLILFSLFVLVSCGHRAPSPSEVRIAVLRGPSAVSMIRMMEDGFSFSGEKAVFHIYNEPIQVQALMMKGDVDIALIPGNQSAVLYNKGSGYKLVSVPVWGTLFLAGTDTTGSNWNSMKGKRIYLMARGATPDIVFRRMLELHQLRPDTDVILDYSFPNHLELFTAITAGRAPLGVLAEPFLSQAIQQNHEIKVGMNLEYEWNRIFSDSIPMMQTACMARDSFCLTHQAWLTEFHNAYSDAIAWLYAHPDSAGDLCVRHGIIKDAEAARISITRSNIMLKKASDVEPGIRRYLQCLLEFNPESVGGKIPDDGFIYYWK